MTNRRRRVPLKLSPLPLNATTHMVCLLRAGLRLGTADRAHLRAQLARFVLSPFKTRRKTMEGGSVSGRSLSVAAAFSRGGFRSSLHKRLDVYLPVAKFIVARPRASYPDVSGAPSEVPAFRKPLGDKSGVLPGPSPLATSTKRRHRQRHSPCLPVERRPAMASLMPFIATLSRTPECRPGVSRTTSALQPALPRS